MVDRSQTTQRALLPIVLLFILLLANAWLDNVSGWMTFAFATTAALTMFDC